VGESGKKKEKKGKKEKGKKKLFHFTTHLLIEFFRSRWRLLRGERERGKKKKKRGKGGGREGGKESSLFRRGWLRLSRRPIVHGQIGRRGGGRKEGKRGKKKKGEERGGEEGRGKTRLTRSGWETMVFEVLFAHRRWYSMRLGVREGRRKREEKKKRGGIGEKGGRGGLYDEESSCIRCSPFSSLVFPEQL